MPSFITGTANTKRRRAAMHAALYLARKDNRTDTSLTNDKTAKASGSIIFSANPANSSTITLGGTVITFGSTVAIGATLAITMASLLAFLNASANVNIVKCTYTGSATAIGIKSKTVNDQTFTLAASAATVSHATLQLPQIRQRASL
jgi:hypothetical protein